MSFTTIVITQRRDKALGHRKKVYAAGESQVVNTEDIMYFTPSVCKREGFTDGITNAKMYIKSGNDSIQLHTTSTVAEITAFDTTNLKNVTVTKRRDKGLQRNGKNFDPLGETHGVNVNAISYAVPSVCKRDGVTHGITNSEVEVDTGEEKIKLFTTETVAEIEALDD